MVSSKPRFTSQLAYLKRKLKVDGYSDAASLISQALWILLNQHADTPLTSDSHARSKQVLHLSDLVPCSPQVMEHQSQCTQTIAEFIEVDEGSMVFTLEAENIVPTCDPCPPFLSGSRISSDKDRVVQDSRGDLHQCEAHMDTDHPADCPPGACPSALTPGLDDSSVVTADAFGSHIQQAVAELAAQFSSFSSAVAATSQQDDRLQHLAVELARAQERIDCLSTSKCNATYSASSLPHSATSSALPCAPFSPGDAVTFAEGRKQMLGFVVGFTRHGKLGVCTYPLTKRSKGCMFVAASTVGRASKPHDVTTEEIADRVRSIRTCCRNVFVDEFDMGD